MRIGSWSLGKLSASAMLFVATASLSACGAGALKDATSGQIGCPSQEITIVDQQTGWSTATWTARCHDQMYYCSSTMTGGNGSQIACHPSNVDSGEVAAVPASTAASAAPVGCQFDTQCKGERVCQGGVCVDPPKAAP